MYIYIYIYVYTILHIHITFPTHVSNRCCFLFTKCLSNDVWPLLAGDISIFASYMLYHPQSWVDTPTDQVVGPCPWVPASICQRKPHLTIRCGCISSYPHWYSNIRFISHLVSRKIFHIPLIPINIPLVWICLVAEEYPLDFARRSTY